MDETEVAQLAKVVDELVAYVAVLGQKFNHDRCPFCGAQRNSGWASESHRETCLTEVATRLRDKLANVEAD